MTLRDRDDCTAFYKRKQSQKKWTEPYEGEADVGGEEQDRNAEKANYKEPDASFLNYKRWDRYGGR